MFFYSTPENLHVIRLFILLLDQADTDIYKINIKMHAQALSYRKKRDGGIEIPIAYNVLFKGFYCHRTNLYVPFS